MYKPLCKLNCMYEWLFQVSAVVDDVYSEHSHVAGSFTMLASSRAHVGGSLNARALPGARVHTNFIGCLKKVSSMSLQIGIKIACNFFYIDLLFCTTSGHTFD